LVISLQEVGFYDSGSAVLRPSSEGTIDRLAVALRDRPENLIIEGHTDNIAIHNSQFASNWELSTARATDFVKLFIDHYHFPASRLAAAGYSEYHPISPNTTAEGRARNRRVDIVIQAPIVTYPIEKQNAPKHAVPAAAVPIQIEGTQKEAKPQIVPTHQ
jgi:chemotaxis protein MotB